MKRFKSYNKLYRRYEVDLWGNVGTHKLNKTVKFLNKVQKEKISYKNYKTEEKKKLNSGLVKKINNRQQILLKKSKDAFRKNYTTKLVPFSAKKKKFEPVKKREFKFASKKKSLVFNSANKNIKGRVRLGSNTSKTVEKKKKKFRFSKQFVYRIDVIDPKRKRAKTSLSREFFLTKTKLTKFYSNIKKHQLRRYANTKTYKIRFKLVRGLSEVSSLKFDNKNLMKKLLALDAFFSVVEHRLDIMLYRSNFVSSIHQAKNFIKHNKILVNGGVINHGNFMLRNFDVVHLKNPNLQRLLQRLKNRLKKKNILMYPPKYISVNYNLMFASIIKNPKLEHVPFPFKIDLRKWLGLAKHMF